jgi:threonine/homoserine/homoserine lactone efflux protein
VQGIVTEVLNPKTAIFFLSFIPQFVDARAGSVFTQFVVLGVISVVLNTAADIVVAVFAGTIGRRLLSSVRARERQRAGTGAVMIGLGAYVAAADAN